MCIRDRGYTDTGRVSLRLHLKTYKILKQKLKRELSSFEHVVSLLNFVNVPIKRELLQQLQKFLCYNRNCELAVDKDYLFCQSLQFSLLITKFCER